MKNGPVPFPYVVPPLGHPKRRVFYHHSTPPLEQRSLRIIASKIQEKFSSDSDLDQKQNYDNFQQIPNESSASTFNAFRIDVRKKKMEEIQEDDLATEKFDNFTTFKSKKVNGVTDRQNDQKIDKIFFEANFDDLLAYNGILTSKIIELTNMEQFSKILVKRLKLLIEEYRKLVKVIFHRFLNDFDDFTEIYEKSRRIFRQSLEKLSIYENLTTTDLEKLKLIIHDTVDNLYKFLNNGKKKTMLKADNPSQDDDYDFLSSNNTTKNNFKIFSKFYKPQILSFIQHTNQILEEILQLFCGFFKNEKENLIIQSRLLIFSAHKLLYVVDIFHQYGQNENRRLNNYVAEKLALFLKNYVKLVKTTNFEEENILLESCRKIFDQILEISALINDFRCFVQNHC
uniref:Uncharacterized protein n=1 Tax=Romanomermis culicivorax TaxID=13658 RepID=A0A915K9L1_ROMCU